MFAPYPANRLHNQHPPPPASVQTTETYTECRRGPSPSASLAAPAMQSARSLCGRQASASLHLVTVEMLNDLSRAVSRVFYLSSPHIILSCGSGDKPLNMNGTFRMARRTPLSQ